MNNKERKKFQKIFAKKNINHYFKLLEDGYCKDFEKDYLKEILRFSTMFNIRLKREEKLKFCKHCLTFFNSKNLKTRLNKNRKTIEYICLNCNSIRRIRYK